MKTIKLTGRNSRLSLLQIEIARQKILTAFPDINIEVVTRISRGDALQDIPLHTVEGSDFFTHDISDDLKNRKADIAIHSLKDMSGVHFFGSNHFAVIDRDDCRDVAVFNRDIEEKIRKGETIIVGTCSPRREEMATVFLKKALPQLNKVIQIETRSIRGNVETRLIKLDSGDYDATILATAGLNRLLKSKDDHKQIKDLLADKQLMILPLIECVPAPCQGAIVAEADPSNPEAVTILKKINEETLFDNCWTEKKESQKYGTGCIQKFGVTTIETLYHKYLYSAGKDAEGTEFIKWDPLPEIGQEGNLFSSTDMMKGFFEYEWSKQKLFIETSSVFVANYKALQNEEGRLLNGKTIHASGTRTWFELAKQGYWVTACADALGFEFLIPALEMPLINISKEDITIVTHESAAERWRKKGMKAAGTYKLVSSDNEQIRISIEEANSVFWSSFSQYEFYGNYVKPGTKHLCPGGETATLLKQHGIDPVIFPTIKAFELWRRYSIRSHNVA